MSTLSLDFRQPRALLWLAAFLVLVFGVGGLIGVNTAPDAWYAALNKPPFNPPNWVFAPVWSVLYVLIAVAGARSFLRDRTGPAMGLWVAQMLINWAWSPTWFTFHLLWPAFLVALAMLAAIVGFIAVSWNRDRVSSWLFVPYAAWVAFASLLSGSVAWLN